MKALGAFIEWFQSRLKGSKHETPPEKAPPAREEKKPAPKQPEAEHIPQVDSNKLHHVFDKKGRELDDILSNYPTEDNAYRAIEGAAHRVVAERNIAGQYKIQIEIDGHKLRCRTEPDSCFK